MTLVNVTFANRFQLIANGDIDVLAAGSTITMDRDVYEVSKFIGNPTRLYSLDTIAKSNVSVSLSSRSLSLGQVLHFHLRLCTMECDLPVCQNSSNAQTMT